MSSVSASPSNSTSTAPTSFSAGVMALMLESSAVRSQSSKLDVQLNSQEMQRLRAEVERAIEAAREAQEDAGMWGGIADFFDGDVARLAQVVAVAALAVGSGGSAVPLLVGAMALTAAAQAAEQAGLDPKLCMALAVAGGLLGVLAGGGAGAAGLSGSIAQYANMTAAGATVVGGGSTVVQKYYEADVTRANAGADRTRAKQQELELLVQQIIERLGQIERDTTRAAATGSQLEQSSHESQIQVTRNIGGGT